MNREEITREVISILREKILGGTQRTITVDEPLGKTGIGLDSLAFVEFSTVLEQAFDMEIPESVWSRHDNLSLNHFIEAILEAQPVTVARPDDLNLSTSERLAANASYRQRIQAMIRNGGVVSAARWIASRGLTRATQSVYRKGTLLILTKDLVGELGNGTAQPKGVTFRIATADDLPALNDLWPPNISHEMLRRFRARMDAGFLCLTAWRGKEVVGIDWITGYGEYDAENGLFIKAAPETCYGVDLYEKYAGEGIGLAVLQYSLTEAKKLGFKRQVTLVSSDNKRMLSASLQLFGFKNVGRVETKWILRKPTSTWYTESQSGQGGVLTL